MLPFLHERLRATEALLAVSSKVLAKHNRLDLDLAPALTAFLDQTIAAYRALNRTSAENQLLALQAEHVSASQGVNPLTLERVTSHRREMQRAIALRVLQRSAEQLRADLERDAKLLADAAAQLRPILLAAMQKGLVRPRVGKPMSQAQLDRLWRAVLNEPDLSLPARQVAMQVSVYDIQLLLADLIDAATPQV